MTETEKWIEQARKYLEATQHRGSESVVGNLKGELDRIELTWLQADLGCGDDCVECSWGTLGGQPLGSEPCRVMVLQQGIAALHESGTPGASARQEATRLIEILDTLPPLQK